MTLFDFDGHKVFHQRLGSGPPTVFLPNATLDGSGGSSKRTTSKPPAT